MGLPNTPPKELDQTERKFRKLLYKFFAARGDLELRQKLTAQMRKMRERLCVSWEKFIDWFLNTLAAYSEAEHERAAKRVTPIYLAYDSEVNRYPTSPFASQAVH